MHDIICFEVRTWCKYQVSKRSAKKVPLEDKCSTCVVFVDRHFKWMGWDELKKLMSRDEKFAKEVRPVLIAYDVSEADVAAVGGGFDKEEVNLATVVGLKIERHGLFLNKEEFNLAMRELVGEDAFDRSPTAPISVTNEKGKPERGIVLSDPTRPHRSITTYAISADERIIHKLHPDEDLVPSLGRRLFNHLLTRRGTKAAGDHGLFAMKAPSSMNELAELMNSGAPPAGSDGEEHDEFAIVDAAGKELKELTPKKGIGSAASVVSQGKMSASCKKSLVGAGSVCDDGEEDDGPLHNSAHHWISRLSLVAAMSGLKLGKEKRFAENAAERLKKAGSEHDAKCILRHLRLVAHAENLTAKKVASLDFRVLFDSVEELKDPDGCIDFPSDVKQALLTKVARPHLEKVQATGDSDESVHLCNMYALWDWDAVLPPQPPSPMMMVMIAWMTRQASSMRLLVMRQTAKAMAAVHARARIALSVLRTPGCISSMGPSRNAAKSFKRPCCIMCSCLSWRRARKCTRRPLPFAQCAHRSTAASAPPTKTSSFVCTSAFRLGIV